MLKGERIKRSIFKTRDEARAEIFNDIEFFYYPTRRPGNNDGLSPMDYEKRCYQRLSTA